MINQYRVVTNKRVAYLCEGQFSLAGDAIALAMAVLCCPLGAIAKVEHECGDITTVLYDESSSAYDQDDLDRLYVACRRK